MSTSTIITIFFKKILSSEGQNCPYQNKWVTNKGAAVYSSGKPFQWAFIADFLNFSPKLFADPPKLLTRYYKVIGFFSRHNFLLQSNMTVVEMMAIFFGKFASSFVLKECGKIMSSNPDLVSASSDFRVNPGRKSSFSERVREFAINSIAVRSANSCFSI